MKQRQSIPFPKPEKDVTLAVASYLLEVSEIPIIFLDIEEFKKSYDGSVTIDLVETQKDVEYITAMNNFTLNKEPAVAVVSPTLCIVGNQTNYYVFDLFNEILYTTTAPEFEFENKIVDVTIYKKSGTATAVPTAAPQPPTKKTKK